MTKRIKILLVVLGLLLIRPLTAQQLPVYSQYMMNSFLINPGVAGHEGYTSVTLTAREQWFLMKDAPSTYAISAQTRILKNSFISRSSSARKKRKAMSRSGRVGLGGYIFSDWNGAFNRTGFQFTYGYHIPFRYSQLSFGGSLTAYQFKIDEKKMKLYDEISFPETWNSKAIIPDANFGVYYTDRNIYAGFSALQLFENILKVTDNADAGFKMVRHYYVIGGYRFEANRSLLIEPSFLFKTTEKFVSQADINLKFYINEDYWGGISYRSGGGYNISEKSINGSGSSIILMGGVKVDKYYFSYAFDYTLSAIRKYSIGSHEIIIAAKFGDNARRYRWLNRY